LLESMDKAQSEFLLEDNPIFLCLSAWLAKPENVGREVTSGILFNDFQIIAVTLGSSFPYKNATSFGIRLRSLIDDLREFFDVKAEKYNNRWTYVFHVARRGGVTVTVTTAKREKWLTWVQWAQGQETEFFSKKAGIEQE